MNYLSTIINFAPKIILGFLGFVFLLGFSRYLSRRQSGFKSLIVVAAAIRIFYAVFQTAAQYYAWSQDALAKLLLNSPRYFWFYAYGRFWLNAFIAIGVAFAFYLFLKFLKKRQDRFFEEGETELGFLAALFVGWPNFVIFVPLVFVSVVLFSILRGIVLKEAYTTLGWPFLLAVIFNFNLGSRLIQIFHLGVLRI